MNNYEFCVHWILNQTPSNGVCTLDYGCGEGRIVKELIRHGVNAFGCDIFYAGGDSSGLIDSELLDSGIIRKMDGCTIPFESDFFEFIVNNQVMEHVENLDGVLSEIKRVLKPGGVVLSLFPDKSVWREGHCGIPFLHWFPKNGRTRGYYAAIFRILGFGYHKGTKSVMRWSNDFCEWLDKWTYYRSWKEIHAIYRKHFCNISHIEDYWLQLRLGERARLIALFPTPIQKLFIRKLIGMVFVACKPESEVQPSPLGRKIKHGGLRDEKSSVFHHDGSVFRGVRLRAAGHWGAGQGSEAENH